MKTLAPPLRLRSNHVRNGAAIIGETSVYFDADGLSGHVSSDVARHSVGVPGFSIAEGELEKGTQPDDLVILTIEVKAPNGKVIHKFNQSEKLEDLFKNNMAKVVVDLPAESIWLLAGASSPPAAETT